MSIVVKYFRQRLHLCEADHLVVFHQVDVKKRAKPVYISHTRAESFTSADEKWPASRTRFESLCAKVLFSFPWRCRSHCASIALDRTHMLRCVAQFVHRAAGVESMYCLKRIFYPENTYSCECVFRDIWYIQFYSLLGETFLIRTGNDDKYCYISFFQNNEILWKSHMRRKIL